MARLSSKALVDLWERTKVSCDKDCANCEMYVYERKKCYHEIEAKLKAWQEDQHRQFAEVLKG